MKRYLEPKDSLTRYAKVNLLNLQAVEQEIDLLISISENPSWELLKEIDGLIKVAKSLGTKRSWQKMITLTFDTWEEFDNAIAGITQLTVSLSEKENN